MIGVTTFVYGWYVDYIPFFINAIREAYPDLHIKIFVQGRISSFCQTALGKLDGFTIVEDYFNDWHESSPYYLRWLIPCEALADFNQTFICDIDLLMLRESPTLVDQRLDIAKSIQMPFANFVRAPKTGFPNRISGWHFILNKEYYEHVEPIIQEFLKAKISIQDFPTYRYDNGFGEARFGQESLLFEIIRRAFGITSELNEQNYPYHHGLHLGPLRRNASRPHWIGPNLVYWTKSNFRQLTGNAKFKEFMKLPKNDKVHTVLTNLVNLCN